MIIYFLILILLISVLLLINILFSVNIPDNEKLTPYECGYSPHFGQTRSRFTIEFYLVGILFLVFDLEVSLLYPLAFSLLNSYVFWIVFIFYIILTLGFIVELVSGVLNFTDKKSSLSNHI